MQSKSRKPLRHRITAWIASFAVLLSSLAPSVSQAINAQRLAVAAPVAEICSADGKASVGTTSGHPNGASSHKTAAQLSLALNAEPTAERPAFQRVDPAADNQAADYSDKHGDNHAELCPFCITHAGSFFLSASVVSLAVPDAGMVSRPILFYQSRRPLFAWSIAHPRGPPAFFS